MNFVTLICAYGGIRIINSHNSTHIQEIFFFENNIEELLS